jgi:hypothetical protein
MKPTRRKTDTLKVVMDKQHKNERLTDSVGTTIYK